MANENDHTLEIQPNTSELCVNVDNQQIIKQEYVVHQDVFQAHVDKSHFEAIYIKQEVKHDNLSTTEDDLPEVNTIQYSNTIRNKVEYPNTSCDDIKVETEDQILVGSPLVKQDGVNNEKKIHTCSVCNTMFDRASKLIIHERVHSSELRYICDVCYKCFGVKSDLAKHRDGHVVRDLHRCNVCNKIFREADYLHLHQENHTPVKDYVCDVEGCGKAFSHMRYLSQHKRIHTGLKLYVCDVCDRAFGHSGHLTYHRRTHTGVKPYICSGCNKSYTRKRNLTEHKCARTDGELQ